MRLARVRGRLVGGLAAAVLVGGVALPGVASTAAAAPAAAAVAPTATDPAALASASATFRHIAPAAVGAVRPGSLHVARSSGDDPATGGYWATARFVPSGRADPAAAAGFQDGGGVGVFRSADGRAWTMTRVGGEPFPCAGQLPAAIQSAWGLADSPYCRAGATGYAAPAVINPLQPTSPIAQVALSQVGVGDVPASTDWSVDCNPYTALIGVPVGSGGCGRSPEFGVLNRNELWCADFAKWVWERGGVRTDLGALTPGSNSFYTWGARQGVPLLPNGHNPAVGDAVVFYPPGELSRAGLAYADHVSIVVGVNTNGTVDLVNGDFMAGDNIYVQQYDNVDVAPWAAAIWGADEHWVYVSPSRVPAAPGPTGAPAAESLALTPGDQGRLATQTPENGLQVFAQGANGWSGPTQLSPNGFAQSTPAVVTDAQGDDRVAVVGPHNSLYFYSESSAGAWRTVELNGAGTALSPPAMIDTSTDHPVVAVVGPHNSLYSYSEVSAGVWRTVEIAGVGAAQSTPSLVNTSTNHPVVAVVGPGNSLVLYWQNSTGIWKGPVVAAGPGRAYTTPSLINSRGNFQVVTVAGPSNRLDAYWEDNQGIWKGPVPIAGPGWAQSDPSMVNNSGSLQSIAVDGPHNTLDLYVEGPDGRWRSPVEIAGIGQGLSAPALLRSSQGLDVIMVEGPDGLDFYRQSPAGTWVSSS